MPERRNTYRGEPIRQDRAWVILRRHVSGTWWFPLAHSAAATREEAIARFDRDEPARSPYRYGRLRRRGEARAVRCRIVVE